MVSDAEYLKMAEESSRESINIAKSDGWNVEKEDKVNNIVGEMKRNNRERNKLRQSWAKLKFSLVKLVDELEIID